MTATATGAGPTPDPLRFLLPPPAALGGPLPRPVPAQPGTVAVFRATPGPGNRQWPRSYERLSPMLRWTAGRWQTAPGRPSRRADRRAGQPPNPDPRAGQRRHLMRRRPSLAGAPSHARQARQACDRQDASGRAQRRARPATPVGARRTPLTRARADLYSGIYSGRHGAAVVCLSPTTESPDANPNPALPAVHGVRGLRWRCGQRAGLSRPADQADRAYDARLGIGRGGPAGGARDGAPAGAADGGG